MWSRLNGIYHEFWKACLRLLIRILHISWQFNKATAWCSVRTVLLLRQLYPVREWTLGPTCTPGQCCSFGPWWLQGVWGSDGGPRSGNTLSNCSSCSWAKFTAWCGILSHCHLNLQHCLIWLYVSKSGSGFPKDFGTVKKKKSVPFIIKGYVI